ncbi:MAG: hypothetical protein BRC25_00495 [Parcubacteria group bacterium SW_6_46_9]|nr:MAG: hypothetical protein BRC25_00495 [Parcubacteria group bacterium SW_6_46_9]
MIVLDIEATGLDPDKHSVVSGGSVEFKQPENRFYLECQMENEKRVAQEALDINGFTREEVTDKSKPAADSLGASRTIMLIFPGRSVFPPRKTWLIIWCYYNHCTARFTVVRYR